MSCSRNEIILLPIPFTNLNSRKVRPAVVIGRSGVDIFVVPITSQISNISFPLQEWAAAGLNVPRWIKAQIATVEERFVIKTVGTLALSDQHRLDGQLRSWLHL